MDTMNPFGHFMPKIYRMADDGASGGSGGSSDGEGGDGGDGDGGHHDGGSQHDSGGGQHDDNAGGDAQKKQEWQASLESTDLQSNATLAKYDSPEAAHKAHVQLASMLGNDKVIWPKGPDDKEGWARVHEKMGVPKESEGYGLDVMEVPDTIKDVAFDRETFQQVMHKHNAPPELAKALWAEYGDMMKSSYTDAVEGFEGKVADTKAELMKSWGDAYEGKVQRANSVVTQFSDTKEMTDYLTATLGSNPMGQKFLASVGDKFAESSVGGFQTGGGLTRTPSEARAEIDRIRSDKSHDYHSDKDSIRAPAVVHMNDLYKQANAGK